MTTTERLLLTTKMAEIKRKSYTTSSAIAEELAQVAEAMGVPESSIVTFAIRQYLLNYRKEEGEKAKFQSQNKQLEMVA
ncbi:hypothetical protein [Anabaena sp. CCY 9910]|uniref:hypothetical protein n=1 Tax=Anabaena sp. CCY 9910 TaxID=3103870 RepID=UPI0039DF40EF